MREPQHAGAGVSPFPQGLSFRQRNASRPSGSRGQLLKALFRIVQGTAESIGRTPLVRINHLSGQPGGVNGPYVLTAATVAFVPMNTDPFPERMPG